LERGTPPPDGLAREPDHEIADAFGSRLTTGVDEDSSIFMERSVTRPVVVGTKGRGSPLGIPSADLEDQPRDASSMTIGVGIKRHPPAFSQSSSDVPGAIMTGLQAGPCDAS
jgi:hypothetical protein